MGPETDMVEPVLAGWLAGCLSGWDVCPDSNSKWLYVCCLANYLLN